jgi:hypothetical protein
MTHKTNYFKAVVFIQIILILEALLLEDIVKVFLPVTEMSKAICEVLFIIPTIAYMYYLYKLVRSFDNNTKTVNVIFVMLFITFIVGGTIASPGVHLLEGMHRRILLFIVQVCLFGAFCKIIYYTLLEIFEDDIQINERLWGCTCLFLMIAIAFTSLYDIVSLIYPHAIGLTHEMRMLDYMHNLSYSINVIGALDTAYPNAIPMIQHISIIEAAWSHIFALVLVGRLLSK